MTTLRRKKKSDPRPDLLTAHRGQEFTILSRVKVVDHDSRQPAEMLEVEFPDGFRAYTWRPEVQMHNNDQGVML